MGDMVRSEKMSLCQLFIQPEAAYNSIAELGEYGCVQFRDLNEEVTSFQRKYVDEVRRSDEMERILHYIEGQLEKHGIKVPIVEKNEEPAAPSARDIIELEARLESIDNEIRELSQNDLKLNRNLLGLIELKLVLESTHSIFASEEVKNVDSNRFGDSRLDGKHQQLGFVAGVIKLDRVFSFERMLWRVSHGNIFLRRSETICLINDADTGLPVPKVVFVAFFQSKQLQLKLKKICTGYRASMYPCPNAHAEREKMIRDVGVRLEDLKLVLNQTADHRNLVLVAAAKNLPLWLIMVKKMKAIYHTLNYFNVDISNNCLIGEGWTPTKDLVNVQEALLKGSEAVGSTIPSFLNVIETDERPPTFVRTNKFTSGFQNLIDSYGYNSYREVNPGLFTMITFPFLFSVMFGDLGHGFIIFLCGLFLCVREKHLTHIKGEIFSIFFSGRYIILLMGLFAMYTGFVYNEVFSMSINVFGSGWRVNYNTSTVFSNPTLQLDPRYATVGTYPLGVDPIWQMAANKIIFLNTFKMKLSIIIGVVHMLLGLVVSVINFNYFKKRVNILLMFVPQSLFLLLLFGYMVFLMFFKFVKYSGTTDILAETPGCAPSILILFIDMVLFKEPTALKGCDAYMFAGQRELETIFVVIALICIPWMLLGKPLYIMIRRKGNSMEYQLHEDSAQPNPDTNSNDTDIKPPTSATKSAPAIGGHDIEHEPMSEIFMQTSIHTIEYVLSTISHTASYLRLWALSLAHSQLSEILWSKVMVVGFSSSYVGIILLFCVFAFFAVLTIGILVIIEGLSAFLHTLRLHWVEFMSKFYGGLGYAFEPLSFKKILEEKSDF